MDSRQLLAQLATDTLVALKPSPVHGIGVFAIADIPKGFRKIFSPPADNWIRVPVAEVDQLPDHARELVETYCLYDDTDYFLPDYGFKIMDLVNYLNHSAEPNLVSVSDGEYFEAIRDIRTGEELFVDYGSIVDVTGYR
ncbi:MAG: SET domain-containing protein-lysine N-methyltransferase [Chitinophagaceae bacterium]|nr:MAG: SET domain-containing protein-lysine N-methyltransferase [Chitinophagaceae bacterium]